MSISPSESVHLCSVTENVRLNNAPGTSKEVILKYTPNGVVAEVQITRTREKWDNKVEFLLAVIGFAVDLGNVWRFPYICYRNGGGAFLIPYFTMFLFGGLPLFYMELALGQYYKSGCLSVWKRVCPLFKGIGIAICIINSYVAFFYNTVLSWALYYLFSSMRYEVPWKHCNNTWNTENCSEPRDHAIKYANVSENMTATWISPAEEFFTREVLEMQKSTGLDNMGSVKWSLALCLFAIYFAVYFALWKGPRSSGKAVWVTATLPYFVLFILLIRGATLPGASIGIKYFLTPNWTALAETKVWIDAASQIFFSLGPGFGVLLALASYNDFNNNCFQDAILTSVINSLTSLLSGFVIFSVLGYMSLMLKRPVKEVVGEGGPGLIFVVYPQAIAEMSGSSFWAVIFFIMLITLGLDSTFGGLESIITGICDEFPNSIGSRREWFVLALVIYCYFGSLPTATYGGQYLIEFFDYYGVKLTLIMTVAIEAVAVCWCYGVTRFSQDVQEMLGFKPGIGWRICWSYISPLFIIIIFIFSLADLKPLTVAYYDYPDWSVLVGWCMRLSSLLCIPGYAVYKIASSKGTLWERLKSSITPGPREPPAISTSLQMRTARLSKEDVVATTELIPYTNQA